MSLNTLISDRTSSCSKLFKKIVLSKAALTQEESEALFDYLISTPEASYQCAATLALMKHRGESAEELWGLYKVMSRRVKEIPLAVDGAIDIGGTGGGRPTLNISTAAALIVAAAGVPVCKHGNYRVSSQSGSFDVLSALGIKIERCSSPDFAKHLYEDLGITFLSTRSYHNHPQSLIDIRKSLGVPTGFNVIGPLLNPACVPFQLVGTSQPEKMDAMAKILIDQGRERFLIAYGMEGIDEISPCGDTQILDYKDGVMQSCTLNPSDFNLQAVDKELLNGGTPETNANIIAGIFNNELPEHLNVVLPTAATALWLCNAVASLPEAAQLARRTVESGKVAKLLSQLLKVCNEDTN
ncbi:MAG: anthranilate phosphoribosyltransferase [Candidatus Fimivivens sp.]|nr:anthranilate phosphoribosyltransferase [Candidatus Fimivivens sp.]